MTHSENFLTVRRLYDAYENGDLDAFYQDLAPDIFWKESDGFPTPGVFRTKEEIVENVFSVLARQWTSFRFELENLIDADTHVIAVGTYRGVHGSTSKKFDARASHVWHLSDGKIDRFEQFADTHMMQRAAASGG